MVIRKAGVKDEDRTLQQTVPTDATRWQQSTANEAPQLTSTQFLGTKISQDGAKAKL